MWNVFKNKYSFLIKYYNSKEKNINKIKLEFSRNLSDKEKRKLALNYNIHISTAK